MQQIVLKLKNRKISVFIQNLEKSGGLREKLVYREERPEIGGSPDKSGAVATLMGQEDHVTKFL